MNRKRPRFAGSVKMLSVVFVSILQIACPWHRSYINTNCPDDETYSDASQCHRGDGKNNANGGRCYNKVKPIGQIDLQHHFLESTDLKDLVFKDDSSDLGATSPYAFAMYNSAVSRHLNLQDSSSAPDNNDLLVRNCVKSGTAYDLSLIHI